MDALINAAARALAIGDPLGALKRVALRDDPQALALRGIAMAQLGDFPRAKTLLRSAARAFGARQPVARARCLVAEAEIALVSRELVWPDGFLDAPAGILRAHGDPANAVHADLLEARRQLLIGRLDRAEARLAMLDPDMMASASRSTYWLVSAGIATRRLEITAARKAFAASLAAAREAAIPALIQEVEAAAAVLSAPNACLVTPEGRQLLLLDAVEALFRSDRLVVDACRNTVRCGNRLVPLSTRPVLFALARTLAEAWPGEATRERLLLQAFGARHADESHRARLRVEIGRLRAALEPLAGIRATRLGFRLQPPGAAAVAVLVPPVEEPHAPVLALLADGEAWSSSALALALETSPRTIQRALEDLRAAGRVEGFGRGPARRWIMPPVPGFPTVLLLPGPLSIG